MSRAHLNQLEREVEQTRAKIVDDLSRLRSPANLVAFKDELLEQTKDAAKDGVQRIFADLKERAAANPAAALAIGAGLAWRFIHRPPIATALIGIGLVSLLRTSPQEGPQQRHMDLYDERVGAKRPEEAGIVSQATELAGAVKEKMRDWSSSAADAARETVAQIAEKTGAVTERASNVMQDARHAARETVSTMADKAAAVTNRASNAVQDTSDGVRQTVSQLRDKAAVVADRASNAVTDAIPDQADRDKYLLGAAALAVAAAVGIAYQRRAASEH